MPMPAGWTNRACLYGLGPRSTANPCEGCLHAPPPVACIEPDGTVTIVPVSDQIEAIRRCRRDEELREWAAASYARARERLRVHDEIQAAMTDMNERLTALDQEQQVMGVLPSPEMERIQNLYERWRNADEALESLAAEIRRRTDYVDREEGVEAAPAQEGEEEDMRSNQHDFAYGTDGQGAQVFVVYDEVAHLMTPGVDEAYSLPFIQEDPVVEFLPGPPDEVLPPLPAPWSPGKSLLTGIIARSLDDLRSRIQERMSNEASMPREPELRPGDAVVFADSDPASRRQWKIISIAYTTCTIGRGSTVKTSVSLDRLKKAEEA